MSDLQLLDGGHYRPQIRSAEYWALRNRADFEATNVRCDREATAYEASHAPTVLWTDARTRRQGARRRRERACRDAAAGVAGIGVCAFGLLGPSLLALPHYLAGLAALFLAALVAVHVWARGAK